MFQSTNDRRDNVLPDQSQTRSLKLSSIYPVQIDQHRLAGSDKQVGSE